MSCRNNFLFMAAAVAIFAPAITPSVSQAAALSGSYGFSRMVAGFPGANEAMALAGSGSITFNADGNCNARFDDTEFAQDLMTGEVTRSSGGQNRACSYTAASNGDLTLTFTENNVSYRGSVSADGSSLNLAGSESDIPGKVQMLLGYKSGSGLTAAALNGSYPVTWTAAGFPSAAESNVLAGTGAITFDGVGGCSAKLPESGFTLNRSTKSVAQIPASNVDYGCGYSISSQGTVDVTLTREEETISYKGSVSADGSSFTIAGSSENGKRTTLLTGRQAGVGLTQAALVGTYGIARMKLGFPSGTESTALGGWGAITFDGNGKCSTSFIDAAYSQLLPSGAIADNSKAANLSCSYNVELDGGVNLSFGGAVTPFRGHISADSSSFTVAGPDQADHGKVMLLAGERLEIRYPSADIAGKWMSAGIKTPVSNTNDPNNFGYDVDRMTLHVDGSGVSESVSTSDPSPVSGLETLPAGAITINDDAALKDATRNEFFYMNAGKNVMFQFRKDLEAGEQQFFVNVKQAANYTAADVAGTWLGAGIKTPVKFNSDADNFGYDVGRMVLNADGSGSNWLRSSSTPIPAGTVGANELFAAGHFGILPDGKKTSSDPNHHFAINAAKDVMFRFRIDLNGVQQLFVNVKQGTDYTMDDLTGKWVGAGLKTPLNGNPSSATPGYEVAKLTLNSDGSGFYEPTSSSKEWAFGMVYGTNHFNIGSDGTITTFYGDNEFFFMNASKDVLVQFKKDPMYGQQQLFVYLKEAAVPVFPINGSCGAAHNASFISAPTANLCSSGTASALTGTGPWSWNCSGDNGGTTASCATADNVSVSTWTLTVAVTGSGTVNGSSSTNDTSIISCSNDSASGCSASFNSGESVQLTASPSAGSLFTSWSGSISGTATPFTVVMDGDKAVTATFNLVPKVMVGSKGFTTLQAAYDDANTVDGSVIKLLEGDLPGAFTAAKQIKVKVEGGYNETFASRTSSTSLQSPFKVKSGEVRVQGIKIAP